MRDNNLRDLPFHLHLMSVLQVAGSFLQEILELSVRDSLEGLSKAALEVLVVVTLFPTGAPVLTCVVETVWQCSSSKPNSNIWVSPEPSDHHQTSQRVPILPIC